MIKGILNSLIGNASEILDEVITTDEERATAKERLKKLIFDYRIELEKNITERHKNDMRSDSWLSKNVRPMTLVFVIVCTMLLVFIDSGSIAFQVEDKWTDLLQLTLITVIGAYFGGRSVEKFKSK